MFFKQSLQVKSAAVPDFSCKGQSTNLARPQDHPSEPNIHPCKPDKNDEQTMSITPYPGRNRSSSKERGGASQGSKNYRMLQGSFGSKPGSRAGAAAVAWSAAAAAAGSAAAD